MRQRKKNWIYFSVYSCKQNRIYLIKGNHQELSPSIVLYYEMAEAFH